MEKCIDEEKNITHEQLSDNTDAALSDPKQFRQLKLPSDVSSIVLHWPGFRYLVFYSKSFFLKRSTNPTSNGAILPLYKVEAIIS